MRRASSRVESGEGIEIDLADTLDDAEFSVVESGEGIEMKLSQSQNTSTDIRLWNPVKELKYYLRMRPGRILYFKWNPVKELKLSRGSSTVIPAISGIR